MTKFCLAAASALLLFFSAQVLAKGDAIAIPAEKTFPSSAGAVVFHHEMHAKDLAVPCSGCHHAINAKQLKTPHADYLKASTIKCEICHAESGPSKQTIYACTGCHRNNPANIADETLSAKVVVHKQCWKCHPVSSGKEASAGCEKCHSGKKTF